MESPLNRQKSDKNTDNLTDEELVKLIVKSKNSACYGVLYDRYADKVYNKCMSFIPQKEEAQDLTHDLFIKLYFKLSTFEFRSSFSTWLYTFTYNFCLNYLNRQHKEKKDKERDLEEYLDKELEEIDDSELMSLKSEKLAKALKLIDPRDRLILLMKYQDEFSIKEISESLQLGESAVKMRINRAKKRVLDEYKNLEA